MRRAALWYTLGRFGLFFLIAVLLWSGSSLVGSPLNGLPLLLVAALVSSVLGYVLFAKQRLALAEALDAQRRARVEQQAARQARLENES